MKYRNVTTGAIIDSPCLILGKDWEELIENTTNENEETVEDVEATEETEEPKKGKKSNKK